MANSTCIPRTTKNTQYKLAWLQINLTLTFFTDRCKPVLKLSYLVYENITQYEGNVAMLPDLNIYRYWSTKIYEIVWNIDHRKMISGSEEIVINRVMYE